MGTSGPGRDDESVTPYYIPATAETTSERQRVLKRGDLFAVLDRFGSAQATGPGAEGLFFEDTRYLSQLALTIDGVRPLLLSSYATEDNLALAIDLTNPDLAPSKAGGRRMKLSKGIIHILTNTTLSDDTLLQRLAIKNYGMVSAHFRLQLAFDADYADIFEVRGAVRARRGDRLPDEQVPNGTVMGYRGLDGLVRRTRLVLTPAAALTASRRATWTLDLPAHGERTIEIAIRCERNGEPVRPITYAEALAEGMNAQTTRRSRIASISTSNEHFDAWLKQSQADLDMLVTETPHGPYPYAGIPWFSTAFGRDGIITALQCLWLDPDLAAGTLSYLAANQATAIDPRADAEPGKILHETRKGEMANLGEVPFAHYFGGVDSTPLFIVLAAAYYDRTGDLGLIRALWPQIDKALAWIRDFGDLDGDGFVEYDRKSLNGLINQGWKDSADSVFHADGSLAQAPIALAEVQAYTYAAYLGAARLAGALGATYRATELNAAAATLKDRFERAFWVEELGTYALALDGDKRPCRVRVSNAGHVLFGNLASPERAARVAEGLLTPASFSQWGIRTLADTERRYNPISYHNGSVWPHDNAIIGMGFARYGLSEPLMVVFGALFDASIFMEDQRLPELFCGFERRAGSGPTTYPVACIPQAWSSAAVFGLFGAALGLSFYPASARIKFARPSLPPGIEECRITNLRLGDSAVDLLIERRRDKIAVRVLDQTGPVEIVVAT
jgi:glycogen debranching enzyme